MRRGPLGLVLIACALLGAACARSLTVAAAVTFPARAPVFVFPSVWVAGGKYDEEVYLLDRIATFLARDQRREVRRVPVDQLEPARQAGDISWLTAVVQLSLSLRSSERMHTSLMPLTYCSPFSCGLTSYGMYSSYVPLMRAEVVLTVHEGPTARVLSRETFTEEIDGDSISGARQELIERMAEQLEDGVDLHMRRMAFTLQQTGIRTVDDGIALLSRGKYKEGRALLETAAKSLGGEKRQIQARALHALGIARVLAPSPGSSDLSDALRALRLAEKTDTRPRYRETIRRIEEHSKQVKVLAAQQKAYAHNFRLAGKEPSSEVTSAKPVPPPAPPAKGAPASPPKEAPPASKPESVPAAAAEPAPASKPASAPAPAPAGK